MKQWLASKGCVRTDKEMAERAWKALHPTEEEIEEEIKILEEGPDAYLMENDIGEPVWITREKMIERVKKTICP